MPVRYEICVGLNKGHKTAKIKNVKYTGDKKVKGLRSSRLKNVSLKFLIWVGCVWHRNDENQYIHSQTARVQISLEQNPLQYSFVIGFLFLFDLLAYG